MLRRFYDRAFTEVLAEGKAWQHVYECSSPERSRSFRMRVALLDDRSHLVIVNDLVHESPHAARTSIDSTGYVGAGGLVVQCAHCRRCRRPDTELWDWVPAYVSEPPAYVSHGFCPPCVAYHYPA